VTSRSLYLDPVPNTTHQTLRLLNEHAPHSFALVPIPSIFTICHTLTTSRLSKSGPDRSSFHSRASLLLFRLTPTSRMRQFYKMGVRGKGCGVAGRETRRRRSTDPRALKKLHQPVPPSCWYIPKSIHQRLVSFHYHSHYLPSYSTTYSHIGTGVVYGPPNIPYPPAPHTSYGRSKEESMKHDPLCNVGHSFTAAGLRSRRRRWKGFCAVLPIMSLLPTCNSNTAW
jgi:hypothetical protein